MSLAVKTPNAEQMIAIKHLGGKILSAGAGSGKTFVLIEHIVTWLENIRAKTPKEEWIHVIPFKLPKIVLMTFTKKAAGEMSVRLMRKLDELCMIHEEDEVFEFWNLVRQYLSMMNVTTISSFCHQLLSLGYFPDVGSDIQILSNIEYKNKISNLFNLWFISESERLGQVFQANSGALINAMIDIYNSPELRLMWKEPIAKSTPEAELATFVDKMVETLELEDLFNEGVDLNADQKDREKGWFIFLQAFDALTTKVGRISSQNFKEYAEWTTSVGRLPTEVKSMSEDQKVALSNLKALVKELRDVQEDFLNFIDYYDIYWSWVEIFKSVYDFIDQNYFSEKGFSFADLEYYACVNLRDPSLREKVKKDFDYFIVDEFQDTSSVQYEIIQHLVGSTHQRLFCVGDKKQAIYGFRGGELLVFNQCAQMLGTENNIWLKNNFRSEGKIIGFNNAFFERVFPLGSGFEGVDPNTVVMEAQNIPESKVTLGEVVRLRTEILNVENEKKLDLDTYEAEALYEVIKELLENDDIDDICVLYRKLRPSSLLIDLLSKNEVSFSAQVKIEYGEDPIINLFLRAIELKLNQNDSVKLSSTHFLMKTLLEVLGVEADLATIQEKFLSDLSILGLRLAFHKMIYALGISNSQYQENAKLIDSICNICNEDLVRVFHLLSSESQEQYSLDLMNGGNGKKIVIMSAHASKGLEFDAVLLGGIHSNGVQMGKTDVVGKLPKSFRWKRVYNQKKFYKSPMYYLEAELEKAKEFSESKRLLYVACTRAIKYLAWVDLWASVEGTPKELASGANHWIKAMRLFDDEKFLIQRELKIESKTELKKNDISLVLKDSLGLLSLKEKGRLGVFAETSVTKLSQLSQCPFKFYLSNICKISPAKMPAKALWGSEDEEEIIDAEEVFYSSMERGTRVHAKLSKLLLKEIEIEEVEVEEKEKVEWVLKEASLLSKDKNIISEKQIKFSLFGQMISGTPDLVFENVDHLHVWDFKTGMRNVENEESYWFQLFCYGYAYANLKHFTPEKMIPLTLVYIDQKETVTKTLSLREISDFLFEKWTKTESLNQVNLAHCRHCDYSSLCIHYKSSAH